MVDQVYRCLFAKESFPLIYFNKTEIDTRIVFKWKKRSAFERH